MRKERELTTSKMTESTNTWNIFKKKKEKSSGTSNFLSETGSSGAAVANPVYSTTTIGQEETAVFVKKNLTEEEASNVKDETGTNVQSAVNPLYEVPCNNSRL